MAAHGEPTVLLWYRLYCGAMAFLYFLCILGGAALLLFHQTLGAEDPETPPLLWAIYGAILLGMGLLLGGAYVAAFFLPRTRWAWIYHLVMIAIGLTSCCCMLASIPLLIFWIRPETQEWFRPGPPVAA